MEKPQMRIKQLENHVEMLTRTIGERSVRKPENLDKTADYIRRCYESYGLKTRLQTYTYHNRSVANVIAETETANPHTARYIVGAHYDSVAGTVGADDNASAVAVQLETARALKAHLDLEALDLSVVFVSFALEEPPAYNTGHMGSRIYARRAKKEKIDGMICLEMVGYTCREPGCQNYPFPLGFRNYPDTGNFIGIVGNWRSRAFSRDLLAAFHRNAELPAIKLTVPFNGYILPSVRLSDHASFWDSGFKAVMVTDTAFFRNPNYHTPQDTMETLDFEYMAQLVESLMLFFSGSSNR